MLERFFLLWPSDLLDHVSFVFWLFSFLHACLLTYQLSRNTKLRICLISFCIFIVVQLVVFAAEMHLMLRPDFDDSAGAMFVPTLLLLPSLLLVALVSLSSLIRLIIFLAMKFKNFY